MNAKLISCVVTSGTVERTFKGKSFLLTKGDALELPEAEAHRLEALGVVKIGGTPYSPELVVTAGKLRDEIAHHEPDLAGKREKLKVIRQGRLL